MDALYRRFSGLSLVAQSPVAELYTGTDASGVPVSVAVLREQAAADPAVHGAFAAAVSRNSYAQQPGDIAVHAAELSAPRPWAATYRRPGKVGAERLLAGLPGGPIVPVVPVAYPAAGPERGSASSGHRVALIAGGVVLLLAAAVGVFFLGGSLADREPVARPTTAPSRTGTAAPPPVAPPSDPSPSASGTPRPVKPSLRDADPVTVVGPAFAAGEATFAMRFDGWPFAFRTPRTWRCVSGNAKKIPEAKAWVCNDRAPSGDRQKVNIILRQCPTTCTAAEQVTMNRDWLDEPERAEVLRQRTYYVQTAKNSRGLYAVDSSHFFGGTGDRALRWQVGVFVESPTRTRNEVLKILNDVVTQAG